MTLYSYEAHIIDPGTGKATHSVQGRYVAETPSRESAYQKARNALTGIAGEIRVIYFDREIVDCIIEAE